MTTDFANLPADITPSVFFAAIAEALKDEPAPANAAPDKLLLHVTGDEGGTWAMGFVNGRLAIDQSAADKPPLQVTTSIEDFRAFLAGSVRDALKAKAGSKASAIDAKQVAKLFRITTKTDQVKQYTGDLQLVVENSPSNHKLTLTFGGTTPNPAKPTTTISKNAVPRNSAETFCRKVGSISSSCLWKKQKVRSTRLRLSSMVFH